MGKTTHAKKHVFCTCCIFEKKNQETCIGMKKPKMTNDVIQRIGDKILHHRKLIMVFDPNSSKYHYTQPRESSTYECACRLLKVDRLFYGPKGLKWQNFNAENCFVAKSFLYNEKILDLHNTGS